MLFNTCRIFMTTMDTNVGPIPYRMHFKLPITAIASITNRVTGVGLTAGMGIHA